MFSGSRPKSRGFPLVERHLIQDEKPQIPAEADIRQSWKQTVPVTAASVRVSLVRGADSTGGSAPATNPATYAVALDTSAIFAISLASPVVLLVRPRLRATRPRLRHCHPSPKPRLQPRGWTSSSPRLSLPLLTAIRAQHSPMPLP